MKAIQDQAQHRAEPNRNRRHRTSQQKIRCGSIALLFHGPIDLQVISWAVRHWYSISKTPRLTYRVRQIDIRSLEGVIECLLL